MPALAAIGATPARYRAGMPKPISREDVTARAEQVLTQRRDAVAALADAQASVDDLTATFARELDDLRAAQAARLKDAAAANTRAWTGALGAGWSEEDLRRFGFTEPEVKTRARRARATSAPAAPAPPSLSAASASGTDVEAGSAAAPGSPADGAGPTAPVAAAAQPAAATAL